MWMPKNVPAPLSFKEYNDLSENGYLTSFPDEQFGKHLIGRVQRRSAGLQRCR